MVRAFVLMYSDDYPKGNYGDLKKTGELPKNKAGDSFAITACNLEYTNVHYIQQCSLDISEASGRTSMP
jgi:hypothetical protein